jgi:hypothetical protein
MEKGFNLSSARNREALRLSGGKKTRRISLTGSFLVFAEAQSEKLGIGRAGVKSNKG